MKAVIVKKPGGPEVLEYTDVPKPEVKPGWSLVKVKGFGINHSEIFTRQGESPDVEFPRILGIEAVGEVAATSDSDRLPVGLKVISIMGEMGRAYDGGYAEFVLLPNDQIYPVETALNWVDLAAVPETYYTAYGALKGLQLQTSDRLLVRGATSGVGVAAIKLAKVMAPGISITGTSRTLQKEPLLFDLGVNEVVADEDARLQTGDSYDKIFDLIGPKSMSDSFKHLNNYGILSQTGQLGGQWTVDDFDPIFDIPNDRYLTGFYSGDVDEKVLQELFTLIDQAHIDVSPERVFDLAHTRDAHEYLDGYVSFGKVVVVP